MTVVRRVVVLAVIVSLVVLMFHGCMANLRTSGVTVYQFFRAVGAGDAPAACRLLSGAALDRFQSRTRTTTCEAAVTRVHRGLSQADREELVRGEMAVTEYHSAIRLDFSRRKEIVLERNPLGMELIVLAEHDGRETISDWGWGVRELS